MILHDRITKQDIKDINLKLDVNEKYWVCT